MSREHAHLSVVADADALAKAAADCLLKRINQASGRLAVCLTGGSTPERLYALLATEPYCQRVLDTVTARSVSGRLCYGG
jgi:6-phosphogluconolactonase